MRILQLRFLASKWPRSLDDFTPSPNDFQNEYRRPCVAAIGGSGGGIWGGGARFGCG